MLGNDGKRVIAKKLFPTGGEDLKSELILDGSHDPLWGDQYDPDGNRAKDQKTDAWIF